MDCYICHATNDLYKSGIKSNGEQRYCCRECNTKKCRKYRKTVSGKESRYKAIKRYASLNRGRVSAWAKVKNMSSKPCFVCGIIKTHKHHPDISKPLEVIYVCPLHHKLIEKTLK